ncbi:hypothetical protein [Bacillus sp. 1P06AnD]|uniref:hypothetical protein n=1 Tax=Bacillus sp. 1P06AnD TaxID=3132208 RepID=UPI0039A3C12C
MGFKKRSFNFVWMFLVAFSVISLLFPQARTFAANEEIAIDTDAPGHVLINVKNLKPGDWIPRNITIYNNGKRNFKYTTSAENRSLSEKLFKKMTLQVKQGNTWLYSGLLQDFEKLSPRFLASGSSEVLSFRIDIPGELGNDYQQSKASVDLVFTAEATDDTGGGGTTDPGDNGGGNNPGPGDNGGGTNPDPGGNEGGTNPDPGDNGGGTNPDPGDNEGGNNPDPGGNGEGTNPNPGGNNGGGTNPNPGDNGNGNNSGNPQTSPSPSTPTQSGGTLPNTATDFYNILILGFLVGGAGAALLFIQHRKMTKNR